LRRKLPDVLQFTEAKEILDAPCGDFNWFRHVELPPGVRYTGADIVPALIEANQKAFGDADTTFRVLDITQGDFPSADLWICRDCIQHLSTKDALAALENFRHSGIPYALMSTHPDCRFNGDMISGGYRQVNLRLPPFSLGEPLIVIDDYEAGAARRQMGLWSRDQIQP
jgi:SAM-dependent methyltransferase